MNSKIRNALLIIMNERSFELSANSVYVRVHVYCPREYDVLSIFVHKVVAQHISVENLLIKFNTA